jgi:hypothetical protein
MKIYSLILAAYLWQFKQFFNWYSPLLSNCRLIEAVLFESIVSQMLWNEVIGRDVQLGFGLIVIVTAHVFAVVNEFMVLFVPFVVRTDRWLDILEALLHIAVIYCYGSFLLQTYRAPFSERPINFIEPRIGTTCRQFCSLALCDIAKSVDELLVLNLDFVLVKERYRPEYFSFGDASFRGRVVDAAPNVAESVVVVSFVLKIDESLRTCH